MKTVHELTIDQLDELKESYAVCLAGTEGRILSQDDLLDAHYIPNDEIFAYYKDTLFSNDDFTPNEFLTQHGIILNINNQGTRTLDQINPDGPICCNGSSGRFEIDPGDMVLLLDWYRYRKDIGAPVYGIEESTVNDIRALLKMLRMDTLPEPVRGLAEKILREI